MNRHALLPLLVLCTLAILPTQKAVATPEGWVTDFEAAKATASEQEKDLLLDFTGSDWCGWCIRLTEEVFGTEAFKSSAPKDFVLVELDYPNDKPQSDELKQQNAELQEQYAISGYPTIILADASGKPYAQTGYQQGGADAYLEHLDQLQAQREQRDEAMAEAEDAEGLDKARALDRALSAVGMELAMQHYADVVEQIVALDAENEAGLKAKYESGLAQSQIGAEVEAALQPLYDGDIDAAIANLDEIIGRDGLDPMIQQGLTALKGQIYLQSGQTDRGIEALRAAVAVDPESQMAPQLEQLIQQFGGAAQQAPTETPAAEEATEAQPAVE